MVIIRTTYYDIQNYILPKEYPELCDSYDFQNEL
jgi:hypothetical protein